MTLRAGALATAYDFSADMLRALRAAEVPADVAAAFTSVTAETVGGWMGGFALSVPAGQSGPVPLSLGSSSEAWRLNPRSIEEALRARLLAAAGAAEATGALRDFAVWLGSSLTRWQMQASLTKWIGTGVLSGSPF